jgi:hypothetical protein
MQKITTIQNKQQIEDVEEQAFYESGLSAHGCLEKLDTYAKQAIQRYGRILIDSLLNQEGQKIVYKTSTTPYTHSLN